MRDAEEFLRTLPSASVRGGEVFLTIDDALSALDWVEAIGATLLGMEAFHLTPGETRASLKHIADFSPTDDVASGPTEVAFAREVLGRWRGEVNAVVLAIAND